MCGLGYVFICRQGRSCEVFKVVAYLTVLIAIIGG